MRQRAAAPRNPGGIPLAEVTGEQKAVSAESQTKAGGAEMTQWAWKDAMACLKCLLEKVASWPLNSDRDRRPGTGLR